MTPEDFDTYVGAEVDLPLYGEQRQGKVTARAQDSNCLEKPIATLFWT